MTFIKKIGEFFKDETREMKKNDWIIIGIMILIYSVISFINLGSMKNPQTFAFFNEDTSVTIEIEGDAREVSKIRHFSGAETGTYTLFGSIDGEEYVEMTDYTDKYVFQWSDTVLEQELKYLKIEASKKGYIGEIQLYGVNNEKISMSASGNKDKLIIDEPQMVPDTISYMNSTYFDEIYFARSAYEYIHNMSAYEWVHPPLGKLIQMIPVALFGMTPFAYRLNR